MTKVRFIDGPLKGSTVEVSDKHYRLVTGSSVDATTEEGVVIRHVHYIVSGRINDIHLAKLAWTEKAA
jgi:hypothetical protein